MEPKKNPRIAIVLSGLPGEDYWSINGGIQLAETEAAAALTKRNEVHLLCAVKNKTLRKTPNATILPHFFLSEHSNMKGIMSSASFVTFVIRELSRLLIYKKCDVIHFTSVFPAYCFLMFIKGLEPIFNANVRIVYTVHNSLYLTKKPEYLFKKYRNEWTFLKRAEVFVIKNAYKVTVASKSYAKFLRKNVVNRRYYIIPNTVGSLDSFSRYERTKRDPNRIVFIGRLAEEKNVERIIRSFDLARKSNPLLQLYVIGDGELFQELFLLTRKLGLNCVKANKAVNCYDEAVVFFGMKTGRDKWKLLSSCSVLCSPTLSEVSPVVALECMALGLRIIGSKIPGWLDYLHVNGVTLVNPRSETDIAESILNYINVSKTVVSKQQAILKKYYASNFAPERVVKLRNVNLYNL